MLESFIVTRIRDFLFHADLELPAQRGAAIARLCGVLRLMRQQSVPAPTFLRFLRYLREIIKNPCDEIKSLREILKTGRGTVDERDVRFFCAQECCSCTQRGS